INKIYLKIKIIIHKLLNKSIYKNNVILFGIPRMIYRNKIIFGRNVRINENVFLHGAGGIEVKSNTTLSYGTTILSTGYEINEWEKSASRAHNVETVIIGENVWIGANTTILQGVSIADNCIIGAGSLVNKSLTETGCLYAGVPAKKIKKI